ncbi:hypothetical protein [Catenibacterium sp. co_0103]|uniref:hypothetical protein n=1 Tax=Catenibacterium sp. co_0103 TaxID=2478954 RepID=UPI00247A81C8|nr:hypothetical protein [Catenibacterium sp. co_0103]
MSLIKITQKRRKDDNQRNVILPLDNRHFITELKDYIPGGKEIYMTKCRKVTKRRKNRDSKILHGT